MPSRLSVWELYGHLAAPYELLVEEGFYGRSQKLVMIARLDDQQFSLHRMIDLDFLADCTQPFAANFARETILEMRTEVRMKIVEGRSYPSVRVWAAENRNQDWILTVPAVPSSIVETWVRQADLSATYSDPQEQAAIDRYKTKVEEDMAKIVRVAPPVAKKKRTPTCPVHEKPFDFDAENNVWFCQEPRKNGKPGQLCNLRQGPRLERTNGELLMGEGRVELHLVAMTPGEGVRLVLVAANNVAIDITALVTTSDIVGHEKIRNVYRKCVLDQDDMRRVEDSVVSVPVVFDGFTIVGAGTNGG